MERAREILGKALRRLKRPEQPLDWLVAVWPLVVGKRLAERTRPLACAAGVLEIGVEGAAWWEQLAEMTDSLRGQINRWWGGQLVRQVKLVPVPATLPVGKASPESLAKPPVPAEPAPERNPFIRRGAQTRRPK
jgi:hypothetical protein